MSCQANVPQAVSVSLPTWRANVGYEEGEEWVISKMKTGYPRYVMGGGHCLLGTTDFKVDSSYTSRFKLSLQRSLRNMDAKTNQPCYSPHMPPRQDVGTFSPSLPPMLKFELLTWYRLKKRNDQRNSS
jgi:hypothetical protein